MYRLCESAERVAEAARKLTAALTADEDQARSTELTGNPSGLRRSRRFPVDHNSPTDMKQLLARIETPTRR